MRKAHVLLTPEMVFSLIAGYGSDTVIYQLSEDSYSFF